MNANDVVTDVIDDNLRRLHRHMDRVSNDCLHFSPDGEANSTAVTLWHMGRLPDVFFTQFVCGEPTDNEIWICSGWATRTGYDPRGIGRDGWGAVNDYTLAEVAAIPRFTSTELLDYHGEVWAAIKAYVRAMPIETLLQNGAGFNGRFSRYQILQMAILDNVRHLGEIYALKAMWERANRKGREERNEKKK